MMVRMAWGKGNSLRTMKKMVRLNFTVCEEEIISIDLTSKIEAQIEDIPGMKTHTY